ncbi:MAG TPA: hypothetical protein DCQ83_03410 [Fibrobacteres bacterium]|jgi:accessory gene regulator protein AgrB|nr:hypothetical protein [Fibrobacterota bacterium]
MKIIIMNIAFSVLMAVMAWLKGFNPIIWLFGGGLPGFLLLVFLPAANAEGIDEETRKARRRRSDIAGLVVVLLTVVVLAALWKYVKGQ